MKIQTKKIMMTQGERHEHFVRNAVQNVRSSCLQRTRIYNMFSLGLRTFFSQKKGLKGQMFVIAAIFMIIGFVLLRNLLTLPEITQEKVYQDTSYLDKNLKNIQREYHYLTGVASMQPQPNLSGSYLGTFSSFLRNDYDMRILYVFVFSNGTSSNFSVTIGNYMKNNISGILNVTSSTPTGRTFVLNDTMNFTLEFNATSAWINATLNYTIQGKETVERLNFNASTRNYVMSFVDMTLQERSFTVRSKSVYNRTWTVS